VKATFKKHKVIKMRANDLGLDPRIEASLKSFGRNGYPTNVVYGGQGEPLLLPEELFARTGIVIEAIETAAKKVAASAQPGA
jgi:thiol:disulfide interchange protein